MQSGCPYQRSRIGIKLDCQVACRDWSQLEEQPHPNANIFQGQACRLAIGSVSATDHSVGICIEPVRAANAREGVGVTHPNRQPDYLRAAIARQWNVGNRNEIERDVAANLNELRNQEIQGATQPQNLVLREYDVHRARASANQRNRNRLIDGCTRRVASDVEGTFQDELGYAGNGRGARGIHGIGAVTINHHSQLTVGKPHPSAARARKRACSRRSDKELTQTSSGRPGRQTDAEVHRQRRHGETGRPIQTTEQVGDLLTSNVDQILECVFAFRAKATKETVDGLEQFAAKVAKVNETEAEQLFSGHSPARKFRLADL